MPACTRLRHRCEFSPRPRSRKSGTAARPLAASRLRFVLALVSTLSGLAPPRMRLGSTFGQPGPGWGLHRRAHRPGTVSAPSREGLRDDAAAVPVRRLRDRDDGRNHAHWTSRSQTSSTTRCTVPGRLKASSFSSGPAHPRARAGDRGPSEDYERCGLMSLPPALPVYWLDLGCHGELLGATSSEALAPAGHLALLTSL